MDTTKLKNINSGLGQFCLHLGRAIQKANQEFEFTYLITPSTSHLLGEQVEYVYANKWTRFLGISSRADVWHSFHHDSPYVSRKKTIKKIVTVHDLNFMIKYSGWKRNRELYKLQREIRQADVVVAISNFTRQEILKHTDIGEKKIEVIYNGLNIPIEAEKRPAFVRFEKYFFSLGIIAAKKNFHVLLPLLKKFKNHSLVIAGNKDSRYAKRLMDEARNLGIADRLVLPGEVTEGEKLWLYRNCEAFLFPSLQEGFGLPVLEAMNEGRPVFCSNHTALPEVGGTQAYYFTDFHPDNMAEVLNNGLADYQSCPDKKMAIQDWAKKFSWEEAAKKYIELYRRLTNS
ncbi:MAG: glycosyltransferase family 4 protein [Bacteroidetes bacterium]|nr:glycosyltransferase family 4 protein [Bacteroidota bacterium]MBS1540081.1 glycosyltransferase family 4 protein [Bacteroidota bacterium]